MKLRTEKECAIELAKSLGITDEKKILIIGMYLIDYGHTKWKEGARTIEKIALENLKLEIEPHAREL